MQLQTRLSALLLIPATALLAALLVLAGCAEPHPRHRSFSGNYFQPLKTERDKQASLLPPGTKLHVRLKDPIATDRGRRFEGRLDRELKLNGRSVVPENARIVGRLTKVLEPGSGKGLTEIGLVLDAVEIAGSEVKIKTETLTFQVPPTSGRIARRGVVYDAGTKLTFKLVKPLRVPADSQTGWLPAPSPPERKSATE
jgi:hypothetical protein